MPSNSQFWTTDKTLTNIAIGRDPNGNEFLGDEIAPVLPVAEKTAFIYRVDQKGDRFRTTNDLRAPGTEARTIDYDFDHPFIYNCVDRSQKKAVPDEHRTMLIGGLRPAATVASEVIGQLKLNREVRIRDMVLTSLPSGDATKSLDINATPWTTTGSFIDDILGQITAMETRCGITPNRIAMDHRVLRVITQHQDFIDRVKYTGQPTLDAVQNAFAAAIGFEPGSVKVAKIAVQNTAAPGAATPTYARIWGECVLLYYVEPPKPNTMNFAMTAAWNNVDMSGEADGGIVEGWRVKRFRKEENSAEFVQAHRYIDEKVLVPEAGFLFRRVLGGAF